jgi:hypothetical protein
MKFALPIKYKQENRQLILFKVQKYTNLLNKKNESGALQIYALFVKP